jgi:nucleoside-diphosphate-sugar epimerase
MNLLITGGSGYVGTRLIYKLINKDINIYNYDISLFGDDHLPKRKNFFYHKKDLRDKKSFEEVIKKNNIDVVLHLACISNDPTFELNSKISKEINYIAFEPLVKISKANKVKKFIYISTCSVYGVSDEPDVKEDHPLIPITDYNKYKALCEPILKKYIDENFHGIIIRPATVCGYSEKMRFDLTVNILTNFAFNKGFINVFGGEQMRPNCHIEDVCNLYEKLIFEDISKFNGEIFNFGSENLKITEIAEIVKNLMKSIYNKEITIKVKESFDPRSYRINSDKIKNAFNFEFKYTVKDAVKDLLDKFSKGNIFQSFNSKWSNISTLKKNKNFLKSFEIN